MSLEQILCAGWQIGVCSAVLSGRDKPPAYCERIITLVNVFLSQIACAARDTSGWRSMMPRRRPPAGVG